MTDYYYMENGKLIDDRTDSPVSPDFLKHLAGEVPLSGRYASVNGGWLPVRDTRNNLPAGPIEVIMTNSGVAFREKSIVYDDVVIIDSNVTPFVLKKVKKLFSMDEFFKKRGYLKKRGILLYGPPGTGKTTTINKLSELMRDMNGIMLYCDDLDWLQMALPQIRGIEGVDRPIIVVLEDIERHQHRQEEKLLSILEGENQTSNIVFLATTNKLGNIPTRVLRNGRLDLKLRTFYPTADERRSFLVAKVELQGEELDTWVEATEGLSFAHLKELDVSVNGFGENFDEVLANIQRDHKAELAEYLEDEENDKEDEPQVEGRAC